MGAVVAALARAPVLADGELAGRFRARHLRDSVGPLGEGSDAMSDVTKPHFEDGLAAVVSAAARGAAQGGGSQKVVGAAVASAIRAWGGRGSSKCAVVAAHHRAQMAPPGTGTHTPGLDVVDWYMDDERCQQERWQVGADGDAAAGGVQVQQKQQRRRRGCRAGRGHSKAARAHTSSSSSERVNDLKAPRHCQAATQTDGTQTDFVVTEQLRDPSSDHVSAYLQGYLAGEEAAEARAVEQLLVRASAMEALAHASAADGALVQAAALRADGEIALSVGANTDALRETAEGAAAHPKVDRDAADWNDLSLEMKMDEVKNMLACLPDQLAHARSSQAAAVRSAAVECVRGRAQLANVLARALGAGHSTLEAECQTLALTAAVFLEDMGSEHGQQQRRRRRR